MREQNWDVSLVMFARNVEGARFEWGLTDCASLVRRVAMAMYGYDVFDGVVETWNDKDSARAALNGLTAPDYLEMAGAIEIPRGFATTGDILVMPGQDEVGLVQLGIVLPSSKALISTIRDGVEIINRWQDAVTPETTVYRLPYEQ